MPVVFAGRDLRERGPDRSLTHTGQETCLRGSSLVAAASTSATSSVSASVTVPASAGTTVAVEKDDGDKNDPEALVVLENVT